MEDGKLIVIDGPEGSGKSTIVEKLKERLASHNDFVFSREPGGTRIGSEIRKIILDSNNVELDEQAVMLLYLADRTQHNNQFIRPTLKKGINIITDRYESSSYAMQGYAEGRLNMFVNLNKALRPKVPDIFIHIDVETVVGLERSFGKAKALGTHSEESKSDKPDELRFEKKGLEFNKKVREGFFKYKEEYLPKSVPRLYFNTTEVKFEDYDNIVEQIVFFILHGYKGNL